MKKHARQMFRRENTSQITEYSCGVLALAAFEACRPRDAEIVVWYYISVLV